MIKKVMIFFWRYPISIRWKLTIPMVFLLLVVVGANIKSYNSLKEINNSVDEIRTNILTKSTQIQHLKDDIGELRNTLKKYFITNASDDKKQSDMLQKKITSDIQKLNKTLVNKDLIKKLDEVSKLIIDFKKENDLTDSLLSKAPNPTVKRIIMTQKFNGITAKEDIIQKKIDHILKEFTKLSNIKMDTIIKNNNENGQLSIIITIIMTIIVLAIILLLDRMISKPIQNTTSILVEIIDSIKTGHADLSKRMPVTTGDELGQIGNSVNSLMEELEKNFYKTLKLISMSAENIAPVNTSMVKSKDTANVSADNAEHVSEATTMMDNNINKLGIILDEAVHLAEQTSKSAKDGEEQLQAMLSSSESTTMEMENLAAEASVLAQNAEQIGNIIGVIDDISEQTALLALNAAIEAARAGEHGRGFAVVADEVRKLAEKTQNSTKEITTMISLIRENTNKLETSTSNATESVRGTMNTTIQSGENFQKVMEAISILNEKFSGISQSFEEQTTAIDQISEKVSVVSNLSKASLHDIDNLVNFLHKLLENIKELSQMYGSYVYSGEGTAFIKAKFWYMSIVKEISEAYLENKTYANRISFEDLSKNVITDKSKINSDFNALKRDIEELNSIISKIFKAKNDKDTKKARENFNYLLEHAQTFFTKLNQLSENY